MKHNNFLSKNFLSKNFFNIKSYHNDIGETMKTMKTNVYWEYLGQKYPYDSKLKYCVFFQGCCCPPHKGHINFIKSVADMLPGCKILINQIGSSSRHGTSTNFNYDLLHKYLNAVFKNKNDFAHLLRESSTNIYNHKFVVNCDVLLIIKGDEVNDDFNKEYNIQNINRKKISKQQKNSLINKKPIKVDYYFLTRDIKNISATQFTKNLIIYKNKLLRHKNVDDELKKILDLIPDEINKNEKMNIINQLIKFNLKE
jgi:hypothetical protein